MAKEKIHYKQVPVLLMQLAIDMLSKEELYELNRWLFYGEEPSSAVKPYTDKIQSYWETLEASHKLQRRGLKQYQEQQQKKQQATPQRKNKSLLDGLDIKYQNGYNPDC